MSKLSDLPYSLQDLAEIIGLEKTIIISRLYGGKRLFVPAGKFPDDHPLRDLIGDQALVLLCQHFGGQLMEICKVDSILIADRNEALITDRSAGMTIPNLARKYGLTERWVRHILSQHRKRQAKQCKTDLDGFYTPPPVQLNFFRSIS